MCAVCECVFFGNGPARMSNIRLRNVLKGYKQRRKGHAKCNKNNIENIYQIEYAECKKNRDLDPRCAKAVSEIPIV